MIRLRFLPTHRNSHGPGLAIFAFANLLGSSALPQEFVGPQVANCAIDIPVHCNTAQPGGGRIIKCLQEKQSEITPECRSAVAPSDFDDATPGITIHVAIDELKSRQGVVVVMLSDDAARFPTPAKRTVITPIGSDRVTVAFRRLRPGTYAASVLHDLDENGKYDGGEGFAATNGAAGRPTFASSAITIDKDTSVSISMQYP